ncbi:MAG: integration host factor subunit alpha [Candidatus Liberibacter ctenarytainae]|uniref:Integration host factor subunit alpha n=1 Tax=Candidatus Liberibacter ctenarytainae TaxID=2020335 RepID=A0A937AE88_9HYPH|nr:integration host factor subunit alpha [Candidatus Liberibacter ctenarytainae]
MKKTVTRSDLVKSIAQKFGVSRKESANFVATVFNEICDSVVRGECVKISSFATFQIREKNSRVGRNPKTGKIVKILPRRVMVFKSSSVLKQRIIDCLHDENLADEDVNQQ